MTPEEIKTIKDRIGDRQVIASVSGGKDSTAMCLHLQELEIPYLAVNMDTGWEHDDTDHYVREVLPQYIGPITTIKANIRVKDEIRPLVERFEGMLGRESQMIRLVLDRAFFPGRQARFCTQELKTFVMRNFLRTLDSDYLSTTGVRAAESVARSKYPEWEWWNVADCEQWRPLLHWSDQDVVDIHKRHGVPPNPLYLRGAHRVGCWPCIYARKSEIRNIADTDPERIELLSQLETAVSLLVQEKMIAKGKTGKLDKGEITWFMNPMARVDPKTGVRPCTYWPIRRVVEWARTKYGGRQFEMFAPPAREWGCMRWGVCDTGNETE